MAAAAICGPQVFFQYIEFSWSHEFSVDRISSERQTMADEFFAEREDQSEVKARIVSDYFAAWASIMAPRSRDGRIAYIDLFAGPGRYEDGSASTPLMVLEKAIQNPKLQAALVSIFNDADDDHSKTLEKEIDRLPDIGKLKHKPQIRTGEVERSVADYFEGVKLIPTFSFIDPFGYKGLSRA